LILKILKFFLNSKNISKKEIENYKIKNVLIVRQHNQLGDMLCSVMLFAAIRKKFPDAKITLVASPINYEILFSEINPYIDDVLVYDKSTFLHLLRFFKNLRNKNFDIGIVPSTVSVSRTSHFINYFSGAKIRVGVKRINDKYNKVEFLLNIKSSFDWDVRKLHQTDRNLEIGKQIGCSLTPEEKKKVIIKLSKEELSFAENFIKSNFSNNSKKIIAFHPGAGKKPNRWGEKNFVNLIEKLYNKFNCYILITSGSIDKEITDKIKNELTAKKINCTILEDTPIRKVGAVILKTNLYITNDTGTMHVASFVNSKVIGLFGPTNGYEWGPLNENGAYIQSRTPNINDITVKEVFEKAGELLNK
jgi:ADP-heptose:LPS heptosyltransferase